MNTAITLEELKKRGCLYVENLSQGNREFRMEVWEGKTAELRKGLWTLVKENGMENSYVDFYFGELDEEARERVLACLNAEEKDYIQQMEIQPGDLFFPMTPELFEITFRLSVTETLFSSFYFALEPCTVWGNYNKTFLVWKRRKIG